MLPRVIPKIENAEIKRRLILSLTPIKANNKPSVSLDNASISCEIAIGIKLLLAVRIPLNAPPSIMNNRDGAIDSIEYTAFPDPKSLENSGENIINRKVNIAPSIKNERNRYFIVPLILSLLSSGSEKTIVIALGIPAEDII
jgi:hypothetical protein